MKKLALIIIMIFVVSLIPVSAEVNGTVTRIGNMQREHKVTKERLEQVKERVAHARETFKEKRGLLSEAREKYKKCMETEEDCEEFAKERRIEAYVFMRESANRMIVFLEKMKTRLEEVEGSERLLKELEYDIRKLDDIVVALDSVSGDITRNEVQRMAKQLKKINQKIVRYSRRHSARIVRQKFKGIFRQAKALENRLEKVLETAKKKGIDTSDLESLIGNFEEKIDSAEEKYEQIKDKLEEAEESDKKEIFKESVKLVQNIKEDLKEAHSILKDIFHKIREKKIEMNEKESSDDETVDSEKTVDSEIVDSDQVEDEEDEEENESETESEESEEDQE